MTKSNARETLYDLDETETMIRETLALAPRGDANPEPRARLDLPRPLSESVEDLGHCTLEIEPTLAKEATMEA